MFDGYGLGINELAVYKRLQQGDATREQLVRHLYANADREPEWSDAVVGVTVHRLKKKLAKHGLKINNGSPGRSKKAVYRLETLEN